MKTTVKKNLIIFHNPSDWSEVYQRLLAEHGAKIAISWVMKRELGFVQRYHRGLVANPNPRKDGPTMYYQDQVHLDFYNESTQSWFILRYLSDSAGADA